MYEVNDRETIKKQIAPLSAIMRLMGEQLTIRLLGAVEIELAGKPVTGLGTRKAEALLAYLVMHKRPFFRERLANLLWDDRPQKQALANLRSLLSGMRRKIKPWLIVTRQTVAFNHKADYWLDVAMFEQIGGNDRLIPAPPDLLPLYRGDFLEGFHLRDCMGFEEWAAVERERLQRLAIRTLCELAVQGLKNGRYSHALQYSDKLLQLDDLNEDGHRLKMELLARNGRRNAALKQYTLCHRLLADELGVEPAPATQALHQRLQSLTVPPPHQLPADAYSFVFLGREKMANEINGRLLSQNSPLLTIVGVGGMGKTRLSVHAARHVVQMHAGRFLDGVFFVPVAAVKTAVTLPFRIAEVIGFSFQGATSPAQQLLTHLCDKEILLILDNMEQLLEQEEAITLIADLLKTAPAITLLITSRERLNLYEERVFALHGLAVPAADVPDPERYGAISLYTRTIRRRDHRFSPSAGEMEAIIRTCKLLEGVPLAIELAAGWATQYNCELIANHTATSLDFLQTTYRNIPPRQRSLRAMFDHSWELLNPELQAIFAALSIFPDTFGAVGGMAVAAADPHQLTALIDKSLLVWEENDEENDGEHAPVNEYNGGRYHIHPLLRQFVAEKRGDENPVVQRHTAFYLQFIEQQGRGESIAERAAIHAELPNIEAVWERAVRTQNYAALNRAAPTLHHFFSAQSWFQEGIDLFQLAVSQLNVPEEEIATHAQLLCELWGRKARMHTQIGQLKEAEAALTAVTPYLPHITDLDQRSALSIYGAYTQFYAGNYAGAINLTQESLQLAMLADNVDGIASAYNFMGSCAKAEGKYNEAQAHFKQAVAFYRQLNDDIGTGIVLHNLGNVAQAMGDFTVAQVYYDDCIVLFKASAFTHGAATALTNAGKSALQQGQYAQASSLLNESLTLKSELGDKRGMAVALTGLGGISVATGAYADAHMQLAKGLQLAEACGDVKSSLDAQAGLAALAIKEGNIDEARVGLTAVLSHPGLVQEVREHAEMLLASVS